MKKKGNYIECPYCKEKRKNGEKYECDKCQNGIIHISEIDSSLIVENDEEYI